MAACVAVSAPPTVPGISTEFFQAREPFTHGGGNYMGELRRALLAVSVWPCTVMGRQRRPRRDE